MVLSIVSRLAYSEIRLNQDIRLGKNIKRKFVVQKEKKVELDTPGVIRTEQFIKLVTYIKRESSIKITYIIHTLKKVFNI